MPAAWQFRTAAGICCTLTVAIPLPVLTSFFGGDICWENVTANISGTKTAARPGEGNKMQRTVALRSGRCFLMGGSMLAMTLMAPSLAQAQQVAGSVESVTVTGYAASLQKATEAKRDSTNFTDTVFAEDIGKFPDTNIAESLNRIPGVTISREVTGEGVNVSIRGLGTNFTKVTLNGDNIAVASTGAADQSNANREVDLNWFPTELFTQLSVSKSPTADMLEGGAAGNVNLRSARPFDQEGFRVTYNLQGSNYSNS